MTSSEITSSAEDRIAFYNSVMGSDQADLRAILLTVILNAGKTIMNRYGSTHLLTLKSERNFATETDMAIENDITGAIKTHFPSHGILGEEAGSTGQSDTIWIIDPIDGTTNFSHGIPLFTTSIGIIHDNRPILGAIYDPVRNELFFAQHGHGAWLNTQQISVSQTNELINATIGLDLYYTTNMAVRIIDSMQTLAPLVRTQRILGCASIAVAYVSCGRLDGFYHNHVLPWDTAAGFLLVTEANGMVTHFDGKPYHPQSGNKTIVASNGLLHDRLLTTIT